MQEKVYGPGSMDYRSGNAHVQFHYLETLNLSTEDLKKKILDVGGGDGHFASRSGGDVTVLDYSADKYLQHSDFAVTGKSHQMPFKDESFELLISSQALPNAYVFNHTTREELEEFRVKKDEDPYSPFAQDWVKEVTGNGENDHTEEFLRESIRVLKPGGMCKYVPVYEVVKDKPVFERYFKHLVPILEKLKSEGLLDFKFVDVTKLMTSHNPSEAFAIKRLEITKK
jgi:ubiquinone/menaquinone biosynthesis C-methylase UbiE